ncbi:BMP family ABC transporter substrate-binding protein [Oceanispirochaeta crateris]|uniref:BMP family ABC transporter substrate-binding protein n=2 Tax=Oceanispirochaeta crateris TaxID=2518645 RepID=A0A5C1QQP1_9SPIO|nr:BMP family ABC transporter substrate-binding protein [Oceanispirochaeta crateris]
MVRQLKLSHTKSISKESKMKKLLIFFIVLMMSSVSLFASGEQDTSEVTQVKVALLLPSSADDKGWSQGMYDAAMRVADSSEGKMVIEYSENMKPVDAGSAARQYIAQGFSYIVFHGTQFNNTVVELAEDFPEVTLIFGTSSELLGDNIISYQPATEQPGYLSGIIAGMATQTGKIGIVGPVDGGDAAQYNRGFWLGIKSVNPDAEIGVAHTGSYGDYVKAGELAQTFINDGFDILAGSAQQGLGALQAVAQYPDKEVYWMGTSELHYQGPEGYKLMAACTYYYDPIFDSVLEAFNRGETSIEGQVLWLTIPNGGFTFSMAEENALLNDDIRGAVKDAEDKLMSGDLKIDWQSVKY